MTNGEKYKTAEERSKAFTNFCYSHRNCLDCAFSKRDGYCKYLWLELEAEAEKETILPCPFCGGKAILNISAESWVECPVCHSRTEMSACDSGAIEKWNRRVC